MCAHQALQRLLKHASVRMVLQLFHSEVPKSSKSIFCREVLLTVMRMSLHIRRRATRSGPRSSVAPGQSPCTSWSWYFPVCVGSISDCLRHRLVLLSLSGGVQSEFPSSHQCSLPARQRDSPRPGSDMFDICVLFVVLDVRVASGSVAIHVLTRCAA